jgi:hypothetical protein
MKSSVQNLALSVAICSSFYSFGMKKEKSPLSGINNTKISFTENQGQVHDQFNNARPDVLFGGRDGALVFHLKENGISYQLNKAENVYRLDINWLNSRSANVLRGTQIDGVGNVYSGARIIEGIKSFENITYRQIYKGIDLAWYSNDGHLKYDYLVAAGANYKQIQLEIKGAEKISINQKGELVLKTPLGEIMEQAPLVKQNGTILKSKWTIDKNILSFDIENLNATQAFVIDPAIRVWGTYYGGAGAEDAYATECDANGNVYMAGPSASTGGTAVATVGSHQATIGGNTDAYLVKFNSAGIRQWATYYGGVGDEDAKGICIDGQGNVYLTGKTVSSASTEIATVGSHQATYGGGTYDAYLVKFNSSGVRQWGTYYGGSNTEFGNGCYCDASGNVYMVGQTLSTGGTTMATVGAHQTINAGGWDGFIVKFDAAGVRQWGTYYGANQADYINDISIDASGDIYVAGQTASNTGTTIATVGSHQATIGGGQDAFLVKFNSAGVRQWGTYYGGTSSDDGTSCSVDGNGDIYIGGNTSSNVSTEIATVGSHQATFGGGLDAYIAKFNNAGVRQWGTYYGGVGTEIGYCYADNLNYVYISGFTSTNSGTAVATVGSHQDTYGGSSQDSYVVKFNSAGVRQWGTYYGGNNLENTYCSPSAYYGNVYLAGQSASTGGTVIASAVAHQTNCAGGPYDAFLVLFTDCPANTPVNATPVANQTLCAGNSTTLSVIGSGTISWFATPSSPVVIGTGNSFVTPTLAAGVYSAYAEAATCTVSSVRATITVTVYALPTMTVSGGGTVCSGGSATLAASGANSYSWNTGVSTSSIIVSPSVTTNYTVVGTSSVNGCASTTTLSVQMVTCTAVHEWNSSAFNWFIYPNPNAGEFTLVMNENTPRSLELFDMTGRIVLRQNTNSEKTTVNIKDLAKGIYFLRMQSADYLKVIKVVKE